MSDLKVTGEITETFRDSKVISEEMMNATLNATLSQIEELLTSRFGDPTVQMGVLAMAQALAFKRALARHNITDRNRRRRMMRLALDDIESKLRRHGIDS